ncbi:MAG: hypothetical protein ACRDZU_03600 [Acidimicrobiales bacterium]
MRWGVLLAVGVSVAFVAPDASGQDPTDITNGFLRTVCDLQWVEGVCEASGYPEPQYASSDDPSPGQPLALRVGAIHNHSGYSDNDFPDTRPADYYRAAKEGHNTADAGGDTGIILDYLLGSDHSENEKLPITTAASCIDPSGIPDALEALDLEGVLVPLQCNNIDQPDSYRKWNETLAQAIEATDVSTDGAYTGFTAMRGFEWTNDYYNHMGVYFSRNVVNAKIDGSYLSMELMWNWLREPVERGGGSDALVVFNHPGGWPALTPFDGDLPHNQLLNDTLGGANWNDLAYVPDLDERVVGIEVNGGDDLSWYVKALGNGWHVGPIAAEDEHQLEWSTSEDGKTLMLTRGRSPRDYYFAFQHHRTVSIGRDLVDGEPGAKAVVPSVLFYADGTDVQDPAATLLGGTITAGGAHTLHLDAAGLPAGSPAVLVDRGGGTPLPLGTAGGDGSLTAAAEVANPTTGEDWWFAVVCPPGTTDCGIGEDYSAVTAPIWAQGASPATPAAPSAPTEPEVGGRGTGRLPATGSPAGAWPAAAALGAALVTVALRRRLRADG